MITTKRFEFRLSQKNNMFENLTNLRTPIDTIKQYIDLENWFYKIQLYDSWKFKYQQWNLYIHNQKYMFLSYFSIFLSIKLIIFSGTLESG